MRNITNEEDKLVVRKALDTVYLAEKRNCACFFGFLNEHEVQLVKDNVHLSDDCFFWGGYDGAKRLFLAVNAQGKHSVPFVCAEFTYKKEYSLTHRDFLGALMSLGIERSTIGDILVYEGRTLVFLKTEIFDYVVSEISKIGRVGVNVRLCEDEDVDYKADVETMCFTVSSLRLDVFVSAVCRLSRDKSQNFIKSDLVTVNHNTVDNVSKLLKVGDVVTVRKYGKFEFTEDCGFSKKGKARISVNHFR